MKKHILFSLFIFCYFACQNDHEPSATTNFSGFKKVSENTSGINIINTIKETPEYNYYTFEYMYNGAGVSVGDINNDGLEDLYFSANQQADKLYLNKGNLQFEDITQKAGIDGLNGWHTGVTMVDLNADGWLDIYICRSGKTTKSTELANLFYENNGNGTFTEKAKDYGIAGGDHSVHSVFFDIENDGDLDLFIANHPLGQQKMTSTKIKELLQSGTSPSDRLYRNDNGKFTDITQNSGIYNFTYTLGVSVADYNKDGFQDIFISADYDESDKLYINQRNGTFAAREQLSFQHIANFGMGSDAADFNNDGWVDLFNLDMAFNDPVRSKTNMPSMQPEKFYSRVKAGFHHQYMHNCLHLNHGNAMFSDVAYLSGVAKTDWSWATFFLDVDNDGWKDIFITNGYRFDMANNDYVNYVKKLGNETDMNSLYKDVPSSPQSNFIFSNKGNLTFDDKSKAWGFGEGVNSNGAAYSDLDNDGDLDIIVNHMEAKSAIYENTGGGGNYLKIRLKGKQKNSHAIGALVEITADGKFQQYHQQPVRGYQSSSTPILHIGLGTASQADSVVIYWPGKTISVLTNIKANQTIEIDANKVSQIAGLPPQPSTNTLFKKISQIAQTPIQHKEQQHNDFAKEILLPHKQSQLGPALALGDANGDGLDDFYIGGAAGQAGQLFLQIPGKLFALSGSQPWAVDQNSEDIGAHFFDADKDGDMDLYVASGSNEFPQNDVRYQDRLYLNNKGTFTKSNALPNFRVSTKTITSSDIDGDGDQDLFVGGRLTPGQYPNPADSYLLLNENGQFKDVTQQFAPDFKQLGMVTDAEFTDIDKDGDADLLITGEWMPITIFENDKGKFKNITTSKGLDKSNGWWWSVTAADLDSDGDEDYVLGNLGTNAKFSASADKPFLVYANDFDDNGNLDIVLTFEDKKGTMRPVRGRECSSEQMPFIQEKFPTFQAFAEASITDIHEPEKLKSAIQYPAYTFESAILWNEGGKLRLEALPIAAQTAPIQDALIDDFDKDGHLDILAAGNMFHTEVETSRYDAGVGYFLKGKGKGNFQVLPNIEHGFFLRNNTKSLSLLHVGPTKVVIVGNNDAPLESFMIQGEW